MNLLKLKLGLIFSFSSIIFAFSQNVGISDATFTPQNLLHVHKSGSNSSIIQITNGASGSTTGDGFTFDLDASLNALLKNYEAGKITFWTSNLERISILSGGNVGIGATNPTSLFSVGSNSEFQVNSTGDIVKINNVTTSFPSSQEAANSVLSNNGSGTLSWSVNPTIGNNFITADGGLASLFTAGEALSQGNLVRASTDGKVYKTDATKPELVIGVAYANASNGSSVYVVTTGIAKVYFSAAVTASAVWAGVSGSTNGEAYTLTAIPSSQTEHDREIGHPIETTSVPGLAKCVVHFR